MEVGPDISAAPAACLANEQRLGQPDFIRPSITGDRGPMAAVVVGAIDQQAANAHRTHFAE
jgi:hypothetical protein